MEQHGNQQEVIEHNENHKKKASKKSKFTGIINGMIGGIIAAIMIAVLFANNLLPISQGEAIHEPNISTPTSNPVPISDMISEDDRNPASIDEVSQAIVGIVNLK